MQSSHPAYITSEDRVIDPETGQLLYDRGHQIPWNEAVRLGIVEGEIDTKSDPKPRSIPARINRIWRKGRNTALRPGGDR